MHHTSRAGVDGLVHVVLSTRTTAVETCFSGVPPQLFLSMGIQITCHGFRNGRFYFNNAQGCNAWSHVMGLHAMQDLSVHIWDGLALLSEGRMKALTEGNWAEGCNRETLYCCQHC